MGCVEIDTVVNTYPVGAVKHTSLNLDLDLVAEARAIQEDDRLVWETIDPQGRRVVLTHLRWLHICARHGELDLEPDVLLDAVARPDRRAPGRGRSEEWFYRHGVGPSRWIRVVVHYEQERSLIVTAFPRRSFP
jgi:hypothetical protein